jgi:ATP-dependent Lhr-like helicase
VAGLGAAQFAMPGAVDRLRAARERAEDSEDHEEPLVVAATDPAQPYGAALAWPDSPGRPARSAGALVVLGSGRALVWLDRRGHHLVTFPSAADDAAWADALASLVKDGRVRALEIRKVNGDPVADAPEVAGALKRVGFVDGYRGLVLRGG